MNFDTHLIWDIISACNFACDYCIAGSHQPKGQAKDQSKNRLQPVAADRVSQTLDETGAIYEINLVGGEPTLLPNFIDICKLLTQKHYIFLSTNLSNFRVFDQFIDQVDPTHITGIDASFHAQERLRKSSFRKYAEYILKLREKGFVVNTNYVAHPGLFDRSDADFAKLNDYGVELKATPFIGFWEGKAYPEAYTMQERNKLFDTAIHTGKWDASVKTGIDNQYCNAGYNVFWVARDGTISKCTTFPEITYGNIYTKMDKSDRKMRKCNADSCSCPYYSVLSTLFNRAKKECGLE